MGPSFHLRTPPSWFFKFPPDSAPAALPPPTDARTFASPFAIPAGIYNDVLDWKVPVTIGAVYASTAIVMNKINRDRGNKAYGFTKTRAFKWFVIAHNVFLAVFSALTFVGMIRALAHTWPGNREHFLFGKFWPGLRVQNSLAGAADSLCKMHGPRGYGSGTYYNPVDNVWENKNRLIKLTGAGTPDPMDVGRLWNEGLAFWGWWFYLSKFYEVLDTFIILAKGKRSSTLQTYHHTGAMMCMWAGIRYMSPPIWMFAFLNSGIHAMMYTYYTLSALGIKVPQRIKRTLTTMQISQFIIGITFAALHLFVTYSVPVQMPYTITHAVTSAASSASSAVSSAASAAATAGLAAWLKKAALRMAGEEGLAENVHNEKGELFGPEARAPAIQRGETLFRTQYETVPCIDTNGQAFAIWLNLAYLAPLTGLFVRFFIRSYSRRGTSAKHPTHRRRGSKALQDAAQGVDRELDNFGKTVENGFGDVANGLRRKINNNGTPKSADKRRVSATIEQAWEKFEKGSEEVIADVKDTIQRSSSKASSLRKKPSEGHDKLRNMFENGEVNGNRSVDSPAHDGKKAKQTAAAATEKTKPLATDAVERLEAAAEASVKKTKEVVGMTADAADQAVNGEYKTIAEDITERSQSLRENDTEGDAQESAANEESSSQRSNSTPELSRQTSSQSSQREPSPRKSKIPQPTTTRSRSPIKKLAAANTPTQRPQSRGTNGNNNTNGTKARQISLSSQNSASRSNSTDDDGTAAAATPGAPARSSSNTTTTSNKDAETNSGALKQDRSTSASSAELEESGVLVEERSGSESVDDLRPLSKHSDHSTASERKRGEGLSSTDPKEDGASFAEKVKEEG